MPALSRKMATTTGAMTHLRIVLAQNFPRDRVVRNELGRVLFLEKHYAMLS